MRNRRTFLREVAGGAAGLVVASSRIAAGAGHAPQPGRAARRLVTVGGRRVKTIDIHAHAFVPEVWDLIKDYDWGRAVKGSITGPLVMRPERLQAMDAQGIDVQALSVNPYWYSAERDVADRLIALQNQKLADLCAAHPDRLVGLAGVALQFPVRAAEQLEEAITGLGMRGAAIGSNVDGEELASPRFDPFWAKAEALGATLFIHPRRAPGDPLTRLRGGGYLTNVIGNPLETTIALAHLIFEGTLDRFPRLKICAAHGGGYLPSYAGRFDQGCRLSPEDCPTQLKKRPSQYLRQLHVDSLVFTPEGLRHLVAECGASQIVVGTDYPYPWTSTPVDHVLDTPGLSDVDRQAILGGNAARLLGIPV